MDNSTKTAKNNGFPINMIEKLKEKLVHQRLKPKYKEPTKHKWIPFTYFSPTVRKIRNLFKDTNIKIAFRSTNTTYKQLPKHPNKAKNPSGIYKIVCKTCKMAYVGQSGRAISTRYKERIRYIRTNNPQSAYATHTLQNKHEFGPKEETLQLLKTCTKGSRMNCWEALLFRNITERVY